MINWLKDLISPVRLTDPYFGSMRYLRDAQFWEAQRVFSPVGNTVEILAKSHLSGPTEKQRDFFVQLEARYESLWPGIRQRLMKEAQRSSAQSRSFTLVTIDLPNSACLDVRPDCDWVLFYETLPAELNVSVHMRGWLLDHIVVEP
jgi:hypothetical protein